MTVISIYAHQVESKEKLLDKLRDNNGAITSLTLFELSPDIETTNKMIECINSNPLTTLVLSNTRFTEHTDALRDALKKKTSLKKLCIDGCFSSNTQRYMVEVALFYARELRHLEMGYIDVKTLEKIKPWILQHSHLESFVIHDSANDDALKNAIAELKPSFDRNKASNKIIDCLNDIKQQKKLDPIRLLQARDSFYAEFNKNKSLTGKKFRNKMLDEFNHVMANHYLALTPPRLEDAKKYFEKITGFCDRNQDKMIRMKAHMALADIYRGENDPNDHDDVLLLAAVNQYQDGLKLLEDIGEPTISKQEKQNYYRTAHTCIEALLEQIGQRSKDYLQASLDEKPEHKGLFFDKKYSEIKAKDAKKQKAEDITAISRSIEPLSEKKSIS